MWYNYYYHFTFLCRLISFENSSNTTIRENTGIIIVVIDYNYDCKFINTTVRENRSIIYNNITHKYTDES